MEAHAIVWLRGLKKVADKQEASHGTILRHAFTKLWLPCGQAITVPPNACNLHDCNRTQLSEHLGDPLSLHGWLAYVPIRRGPLCTDLHESHSLPTIQHSAHLHTPLLQAPCQGVGVHTAAGSGTEHTTTHEAETRLLDRRLHTCGTRCFCVCTDVH
jgi:hypothetical protein